MLSFQDNIWRRNCRCTKWQTESVICTRWLSLFSVLMSLIAKTPINNFGTIFKKWMRESIVVLECIHKIIKEDRFLGINQSCVVEDNECEPWIRQTRRHYLWLVECGLLQEHVYTVWQLAQVGYKQMIVMFTFPNSLCFWVF